MILGIGMHRLLEGMAISTESMGNRTVNVFFFFSRTVTDFYPAGAGVVLMEEKPNGFSPVMGLPGNRIDTQTEPNRNKLITEEPLVLYIHIKRFSSWGFLISDVGILRVREAERQSSSYLLPRTSIDRRQRADRHSSESGAPLLPLSPPEWQHSHLPLPPPQKKWLKHVCWQPGVYNTWEHANVQVSGFKHQTHRSFSSREEAVAALSNFQEGQVGEHVGSYSEVRSSASNSSSSGPGIYSSKQAVEKSYQSHKE